MIYNPAANQYSVAYAGDINIYGLSLTRNIADTKVGVDLSYRRNMPLASQQFLTVLPARADTPGFIGALPQGGETGGAVGDTLHLVLNTTRVFGKTPLFDRASLMGELTWNRMLSVTQGYEQYRGNPAYTGIDRSTRDFVGMGLNVVPTWNQVFPGVDLSMPISYTVGLAGESAVPLGGNKGTGNYSVGLGALVKSKYQLDLKYTSFFGPFEIAPNGTVKSYAGLMSLLKDRAALSLTFKTRF